jgi:hypothetical protein
MLDGTHTLQAGAKLQSSPRLHLSYVSSPDITIGFYFPPALQGAAAPLNYSDIMLLIELARLPTFKMRTMK